MLSDLNNLYTGVIYDALRDMGITDCVLPYNIKPSFPFNDEETTKPSFSRLCWTN